MEVPRIGQMKDVIDITNVTKPYGVDGAGTASSPESVAADIPAYIVPLGGQEQDIAKTQQDQAFSQGYNVWIRYRSDVTVFQQITWGSKTLYQTAPPEEFANGRWLLLHAEETQARDL